MVRTGQLMGPTRTAMVIHSVKVVMMTIEEFSGWDNASCGWKAANGPNAMNSSNAYGNNAVSVMMVSSISANLSIHHGGNAMCGALSFSRNGPADGSLTGFCHIWALKWMESHRQTHLDDESDVEASRLALYHTTHTTMLSQMLSSSMAHAVTQLKQATLDIAELLLLLLLPLLQSDVVCEDS